MKVYRLWSADASLMDHVGAPDAPHCRHGAEHHPKPMLCGPKYGTRLRLSAALLRKRHSGTTPCPRGVYLCSLQIEKRCFTDILRTMCKLETVSRASGIFLCQKLHV
jgi:hypothetical protein